MEYVLLAAAFAVILAGALLFTNAIEWLGNRMSIGEGAVGSLLAAVGTAIPETLIPIVAVIGGAEGSEDVAIGAIIGAPFLLATVAMALVGLAALGYRGRRDQGRELKAHKPTLERDLKFFLIFFACGLALGWGAPAAVRIAAAVGLVIAYGFYVRETLANQGAEQHESTIKGLTIAPTKIQEDPPTVLIVVQLLIGLGAMVGGAHLFVEELLTVAESLGVEPIVLSLVLAPLATELPEKANSFFWVRDGKDALALGNITGAMAFQATLPIAFGLAFTSWELDRFGVASVLLGLAGGGVAYWSLHLRGRFDAISIVAWTLLYGIFLGFVLAS